MDSANKQTAIIAETTQGTTPTSPAYKVLRDVRVSGSPQRPASRSPERPPINTPTRPASRTICSNC